MLQSVVNMAVMHLRFDDGVVGAGIVDVELLYVADLDSPNLLQI